jgi:hypothetical protein
MEICNESLENYFECNYKSYLKRKEPGEKNNLEIMKFGHLAP